MNLSYYLANPFRIVKTLYQRAVRRMHGILAAKKFRTIRRERRDRCWCGGGLRPYRWHTGYGVCDRCGCYINLRPPVATDLQRLYSLDLYWRTRQRTKGFPPIEQRSQSDRSDGRIDFRLEMARKYGPPKGHVIEIGCAQGTLLTELTARGYECVGVEPDEGTAAWTRAATGLDIRSGLFPDVELPSCDLLVSFDVIEHCPDPERFMREVSRLLRAGGTAIIQTPIERYIGDPPFGEMFDHVFEDLEHLVLLNTPAFRRLGESVGLQVVAEDRWQPGSEIMVFRRSGDAP